MHVAERRVRKVQSDLYGEVVVGMEELVEAVEPVREGDYTSPKAVYEVKYSSSLWPLLYAQGGDKTDSDEISDALKNELDKQAQLGIVNKINAMGDTMTLAASSMYTATATFVTDEISESTSYLYTYDKGVPVLVTYIVGEDNAVYAIGNYILFKDISTDSEQDVEDMFVEISSGVPIDVREISK